MMIEWQQGALDTLYMAKESVDKAIKMYEEGKDKDVLSIKSGPLYAALNCATNAKNELKDFLTIAREK